MYIVKWAGPVDKDTRTWFMDNEVGRPWTNVKKLARLYYSKEEALARINSRYPFWSDQISVEFIHPLNIV